MTLKFSWGWRIALLYGSFVAMMLTLVIASSRQKFDLVSKDYYKDEIAYQQIIDANHNHAALSGIMAISADDSYVKISFPAEFTGKDISGTITFYSIVSKEWDKRLPITTINNTMVIDRAMLQHTTYKVKINYAVAGTAYYNENDINLSR